MTIETVAKLAAKITGGRLARAEQAIAAGVVFAVVKATGRKVAIVGSKSGAGSYVVTGLGCTCRGYQGHGYCCHSDAVYLMLAARAERAPAMHVERRADGRTHIVDTSTGRVAGILCPVGPETPEDVDPDFEAWLDGMEARDRAELEIAERTAAAAASAHTGPVGRRREEY